MALFKILKGVEKKDSSGKSVMLNPSATNGAPEIHEGWAYVTTDEGNMYVDVTDKKRVKIGAKSDMVLLNKNPLENIENTKTIDGIIFKGKYYSKNTLEKKLNAE